MNVITTQTAIAQVFKQPPMEIRDNPVALENWICSEYIRLGFATMRDVTSKSFWKDEVVEEFVPC